MSKVVEEELSRLQQEIQDEKELSLLEQKAISRHERLKKEAADRLTKSQNNAYRMERQVEYLQHFLNYERKEDDEGGPL